MKRLGFCVAFVWAVASMLSAQTPSSGPTAPSAAPRRVPAGAASSSTPTLFRNFCFECHGTVKPEAGLSIEQLVAEKSVGEHSQDWERVLEMLDGGLMPPDEASKFPSDAERAAAVSWIHTSLKAYETAHAGEPGRVTVRRLTSAEYAYAVHDLTGIDVKTGIDATSDSVGGEGFTNFGDVQFVQDSSIERYLEAAKLVADHAVVGAGPLDFYPDAGKTGLELSALNRINELYATKGFRVVSGEGGRPFGLERYGKAFYVAWYYKHRAALGNPAATLRDLAEKEGITGRFADHIWSVVNRPDTSYPTRETVERWLKLPAPTADVKASIARARAGCDEIYKALTTWPSWFFARGDVAAGGAGDESPLMFDDVALRAGSAHLYTFALGGRGGRGRAAAAAPATGAAKVFINFTSVNPGPGVSPVIIWRNARVITRAGAAFGGRGGQVGAGNGQVGAGNGQVGAGNGQVGAGNGQVGAGNGQVGAGNGQVGAGNGQVGAGNGQVGAGNGQVGQVPPPAQDAGAAGAAGAAGRGRGAGAVILSTQPLRTVLKADVAAALQFGVSPDGSTLGPDDFAVTGPTSFEVDVPAGGNTLEFQAEAELGKDRNAVVRVMLSNQPEGSSRDASQRFLFGDPASAGYKAFRAAMVQYVSLLPPNSHGEANPADKDPVPAPFDNRYNSPEHDAFVLSVKYQRSDTFFTDNLVDGADRARLNQAWNDLFSSWPYHDAYFGMLADHFKLKLNSRHIVDMTPAAIAALPADARPHVMALRAHYDDVMKAEALAEPGHVTDALAFASRAWRRPLTVAEKASLRAFYQKSRTVNALDHESAIRALVARILVSPAFLYRVEGVARGPERSLNGWEMASRMSFFLWSSVPDAELRRAAEAGELSNPVMLAKQVRRMTADPKARRLSTEFFGQWLGFYHFDEYRGVDTGRFPEFTNEVKASMYDEAVSTFEYLVRRDRPVKELLYADYTFLNAPLAKFYGLDKDVKVGPDMVKVEGAGKFDRGGALRLGAVLTTTSAPLRTSPVKRGDWVLRRILGTPTPPPPANAGSIPGDDKAFNGLTLRERLAQHKRNATCATCHLRIDPLGFPLEGFDAVGRTRDTYQDGKAVDTTGEFADKSTIVGTSGLLGYLKTQDQQVMTTLSKKMLGYALGRTVLASDKPLVTEMIGAGGNASFADLAVKVVTSRQFRHRSAEDEPAQDTSVGAPKQVAKVNTSVPSTSGVR